MNKQSFLKTLIPRLLGIILLFSGFCAQSQLDLPKSADWYSEEADSAIDSENFEYATKILQEAQRLYPDSIDFYLQLGELYYDHEFYQQALKEYLRADEKEPGDFDVLDQIQKIYSYLNQEQNAIDVLSKMIDLFPLEENDQSFWIVDDLGWMYYKTFQNRKGIELVEQALSLRDEDETNRSLLMTLGTLYSGIYDHENSKRNYLEAINEALDRGDSHFASIAYYNLSLLEHSFYYFNEALEYTNKALAQEDRATGHLSKGELYQSKMDFSSALDQYIQGENLDESPLNKINLALLYLLFGDLEMAELYADDVFYQKDTSWLVNFGTDIDRFYQELHDILGDIYAAKAKRSVLLPKENIFETLGAFAEEIRLNLLSYYHKQKYKNYSIMVGRANLAEGNKLDAYLQFYEANDDYKEVALKYLDLSRQEETKFLSHSEYYYAVDIGRIKKDASIIYKALSHFDPDWEKEIQADAYLALAEIEPPGSLGQLEAINNLYAINPGALLKEGFSLPLAVEFSLSTERQKYRNALLDHLRTGHRALLVDRPPSSGFRYRLSLTWGVGNLYYKLYDTQDDMTVVTGQVEIHENAIKPHLIIREIMLKGIYTVKKG